VTLASVVFALAVSVNPVLLNKGATELDPYYSAKIENPFLDVRDLDPHLSPNEWSHGQKLTPRIVPAFIVYFATIAGANPYLPAAVGWILFLWFSSLFLFNETRDRQIVLLISLVLASLPLSSSACGFPFFTQKPFDGITLAFLAMMMVSFRKPFVLAFFFLLALWSDERALITALIILVHAYCTSRRDETYPFNKTLWVTGIAILVYAGIRMILSQMLGWSEPDFSSTGLSILGETASVWQLAFWIPFEGAWLVILGAFFAFYRTSDRKVLLLWIAITALSLASVFLTYDFSRSALFLFPTIFAFLHLPEGSFNSIRLKSLLLAALFLSAISPNLFAIALDELILKIESPFLPSQLNVFFGRLF